MNVKRYDPKLEKDGGLGMPSMTMEASIAGSFVSYSDYEKLAAENAALSKDAQRYRFIRERDLFGSDNEPGLLSWEDLTELECNDFDNALDARLNHPTTGFIELDAKLQALKTPATDAYAASLRAEGVDMAMEAEKPEVANEFQRETFDQCVTAAVKYPQSDLAGKVEMVAWLELFAAQLRSKSEVKS